MTALGLRFRLIDNAGNLVSGGSVTTGSTAYQNGVTLTAANGSAPTVIQTANVTILTSVGSGGTQSLPAITAASTTVTMLDMGNGTYLINTNPSAGEFDVTVAFSTSSPAGHAYNGTSAYQLTQTASLTEWLIQQGIPNAAAAASGGLPTIGTSTGQINPDGTGSVPIALAQALTETTTTATTGGALNAARAQGFGKWVITGTPGSAGSTLTLYASDNVTVIKTFSLATAGARS